MPPNVPIEGRDSSRSLELGVRAQVVLLTGKNCNKFSVDPERNNRSQATTATRLDGREISLRIYE